MSEIMGRTEEKDFFSLLFKTVKPAPFCLIWAQVLFDEYNIGTLWICMCGGS